MPDKNLLRKEILDIKTVLKQVIFTTMEKNAKSSPDCLRDIQGDPINMTSLKLQTFAKSGTRCVICGCKGAYFAKEKYAGEDFYHLNLYALKDGQELLMTKDHIIPVAKGGRDRLQNFQTLCQTCNKKKGSHTKDPVKKKKLKALPDANE